jgi:hypothetical protein
VQKFSLFAIFFALSALIGIGAPKTPKVNPEERDAEFRQFFGTFFAEHDQNHDGKLDLIELKTAIENPQLHGLQSAIAVVFRRRLQGTNDDQPDSLTQDQIRSLAVDRAVQKLVLARAARIAAMSRALFLPGDPNLSSFHQGGIGDCYLLAPVGVFIFLHPQEVKKMIQFQNGGGYEIQFAEGRKVTVSPLTDAEASMVESAHGEHGLWLAVLQKAYGEILLETKLRKHQKAPAPESSVTTDIIGHGGSSGQIMTLLTGHQTTGLSLSRLSKNGSAAAIEKMHSLLKRLSEAHRTMVVYTDADRTVSMPKGIGHHHVIGILGYDPVRRTVRLFNPLGNQLIPTGSAGLINGYPTQHGVFEVPLDEFIQIFIYFEYETGKMAVTHPAPNTADSQP